MSVHLYAICAGSPQRPLGAGVCARPLRTVEAGGLSALVSDAGGAPDGAGENELWQHERAVEQLMAERDVLPVRFGTLLDSDGAVQQELTRREEEFTGALRRVEGSAELAVRAVAKARATAPAGDGSAYMAARAAQERRAQALGKLLDEQLGPLCRERRLRVLAQPRPQARAACLLPRERISRFVNALERLDESLEDASVACTGPWPPYSFVGEQSA